MRLRNYLAAASLAAGIAVSVHAPAQTGEQIRPAAMVPEARNVPWPGGTISLDIDASDVERGLYRVTQRFPLARGTQRMTLLFPEWLPGNHAPRGPIAELVDLRLFANGKPVSWQRDPLDVYAFHVDLPADTRELVARFVHTSPLRTREGRVTMTPEMLNLQWEKMSLYPAGHRVSLIRVKPTVTLPRGWQAATALDGVSRQGDRLTWAETDYETLVDSPIFAGQYFKSWDLGRSARLNAVADEAELLDLNAGQLARLSDLFVEAEAVFGRPAYSHYDFLVALSDKLGGIGLEHLRSSENQLEPRNFTQWDKYDWDRGVLPHELVHSWNGKFRRPARLATPDYRTPMQDDLLWVYEGMTQFWGWVLAARSGVQTKETVLGILASKAGELAETPGRSWRSVGDTTLDPIIAARKSKPYKSLARGEDYYSEGALIWLEADQVIRQGTGGRKGLDDVARVFFAHPGDGLRLKTYEFEDVVAALTSVYPYDWKTFLTARIAESNRAAPLRGIEMAGYRLVWKPDPNPYDKAYMEHSGQLDLTFSLGFTVQKDGDVGEPQWDGPAFKAGIVTGANIVAVDGIAYSPTVIVKALVRAREDRRPVELLVKQGNRYSTIAVPYFDGPRWPWLERASKSGPVSLDRLLAPRRKN